MNSYMIMVVLFIIIFIIAALVLIYLILDEKKLKEVDNKLLVRLGKQYTKEDYENTMFNQYVEILMSIQNANYNLLKDIVSDEEYNKILLKVKSNNDEKVKEVVANIKKGFSKLIGYQVTADLEIAKLWVEYTDNEYTLGNREVENEDGTKEIKEVIISGDKNKDVYHEYILTFVKNRASNEDVVCPSCGYKTNLLTNSKCPKCDSIIVPKRMHWVYVDKVNTNISKNK